ncbi:MAG: hypothetical protein IPP94_15540 [Ignavibacteria bacterium]|nr:hypothetical protein [Ignavibacteria bacterium]
MQRQASITIVAPQEMFFLLLAQKKERKKRAKERLMNNCSEKRCTSIAPKATLAADS